MAYDNSICNSAQKTYVEFAETTCVHGLKNTVTDNYFLRIIWLLIVLGGLAFAVFFILLIWGRYNDEPTKSYIVTQYAPMSEVTFPGVTLCSNNQIDTTKVAAFVDKLTLYNHTAEEVKNALPLLLGMIAGRTYQRGYDKNIDWLRLLLLKNDYASEFEVYRKISVACNEMLLKCVWDGVVINCNDVFSEKFNELGRCCSFNYNVELDKPDLRSKKFGVHMGLKVVVHQRTEDHQYKRFNSHGVTIIVHDATDFPSAGDLYNIVTNKNIQFLHLTATLIDDSEYVKEMDKDLRGCIYSEEGSLEYFLTYSYNNCQLTCSIKMFLKHCHCVPFAFNATGEQLCDARKLRCLQRVSRIMEECTNCYNECGELKFVIFSAGVYLDDDKNAASNLLTGINVSSSSLINIFYGNEQYTRVMRDVSSHNLHTLSLMGGIFSLFLGCSFTSAIEIMYYATIRFIIYITVVNKIDTQRRRVILADPIYPHHTITTFYN